MQALAYVLHALRPIVTMRLWFALLPVALLADPTEGRARKPSRARADGAHGRDDAPSDEQVELQFDGGSKLGLGFVKGSMPLTIRHVTPDTWAAHQSNLHPGVELVRVGASTLFGRSYTDAIDLLRAAVDASSEQAQLPLAFVLRKEVPNSTLGSTPAVGSEKTARRLLAGCASLRERDIQSADRHLSAFLKANGHSVPKRDVVDHHDALHEALQSRAGDLRTRLAFALSHAVRQDLEVEAATIASSRAGAEWGDRQQTLQQRTVDMYNEVAEGAAATALQLRQQTPNPQPTWPQHIELAALGRSSAYSWSTRQLGAAISAQRRVVHLSDGHKMLSATEESETHTQLGILLITRGSVVHSKADHTEAVSELVRARELSPADPYPQA